MQRTSDRSALPGRLCRRLLALLLASLAGCAAAPPAGPNATTWLQVGPSDRGSAGAAADAGGPSAAGLAGASAGGDAVQWSLPAGPPSALLLLQHGFARNCANLRTTAAAAARSGLLVLCVDADMAGGNLQLADQLAAALAAGVQAPGGAAPAAGIEAPGGVAVPHGVIVGGHSAGAVFAARVGARLAAAAPQRLLGALLLDPVAVAGFAADLQAVSAGGRRPVLAITANPGGCNANNSADAALLALHAGFVGLQLTDRSTHVDAEGADSSWLAVAACGQPQPRNAEVLRTLAAQWAADIAAGVPTPAFYPGGAVVQQLRSSGVVRSMAPAEDAAGRVPQRR